ncbi:hypothetical protein IVB12_06405 [Bradyrhizobium sp. 179]|uniref:hypothetical protein n=1 Tax=Bradyrhizobium sp. 179 TaxID=2782648 RepID=UPI001FFBDBF6|nr:hypothetical protein [Bradyrhizobium sp. 179]MCK1541620.1 hypothetical protein [Bradyrhizobium sp. 179]
MDRMIITKFVLSSLVTFVGSVAAYADCNPKDFMVQETTSIQQSGSTELAFVLTATQQEYESAKKNIAGSGSYGLFSGALSYGQAQEKARQIAESTKFDYKNSYASNYLAQSLSGKALDAYVECIEKDKEKPGLALWLQSREGDYFTFRAFWVGANTNLPAAKYDAPPIVDGGSIIGKPDAWLKSKTEEIVVKRNGNNDMYLNLKVGGQYKTRVIVKDPPAVVWAKQPVLSKKMMTASSHGPNPGCSAGSDSDTIHPLHPGGYFVANTRTTNHATSDPSRYGETFTVDRPDQVSVTITQSTGACEVNQTAKGQLQAVETFPTAADAS